jgi:hypothetical protein
MQRVLCPVVLGMGGDICMLSINVIMKIKLGKPRNSMVCYC